MADIDEIQCFGETKEKMIAAFENSVVNSLPHKDPELFYAICILSDAQEEILLGDGIQARQFINKAKYFISEVQKRNGGGE